MSNPLLVDHRLPPFKGIKPEHIVPAVKQLIEDNRALINQLLEKGGPFTWDSLLAKLEAEDSRMNAAWSPVGHMNAVVNSPELRDAYNECLPLFAEFSTEVGQNKDLFKAYESIKESKDFSGLSVAQRKIIEDSLRDFRLSGIDLPKDKQERYGEIKKTYV